jgi:hypothetical protein
VSHAQRNRAIGKPEVTAVKFLEALDFFRDVLLQDVAVLQRELHTLERDSDLAHHSILMNPLFRTREFQNFAQEVNRAVAEAETEPKSPSEKVI